MNDHAIERFKLLGQALDGSGAFAPQVRFDPTTGKPSAVVGRCEIVKHPRESDDKYAARVACAVYENHLAQACARFAAYLGRKSPSRRGADADLVQQFIQDADDCGNPLDVVLYRLVIHTKARGSMLVLVDLPEVDARTTLADALSGTARAVPYITPIAPELLADYVQDDRGRFVSVGIHSTMLIEGKVEAVIRRWTATDWQVWRGTQLVQQGEHPFGQCPVLALTENGATFPVVGKYSQIADLSRRMYNATSELDDILRSQTFSVLTLHIPPEVHDPTQSAADAVATIGTHSMLIHQGSTPAFIAPDSGPAQVYMARIAALQQAIDRIGMETASQPGQQQESGVARKMRFEALNADLAGFARLLQGLEASIWHLFHFALGLQNRVEVEYPTDYNLTDSAAELDILALMQSTGFEPDIQREKRRAVVLSEFDRADPDTLTRLLAAIDESAQADAAGGVA